MKSLILTLGLLMFVSLILTIGATEDKQYYDDALRERFLNYLMQAKREDLLYNQVREVNNPIGRRRQQIAFNTDSDDEDERTFVRRKGVGLHDDPFK